MEIDLDPKTADALGKEADERGFESPEAYARWLLEHRESILSPPGEQLEARLERVEGELERLRRTLEDGFETEITVESGTSGVPDAGTEGEWFDEERTAGEETEPEGGGDLTAGSTEEGDSPDEDAGVSEFAYSADLEPPAEDQTDEPPVEEEPEDAADDDEIAQALADVELEDEESDEQSESAGEDGGTDT